MGEEMHEKKRVPAIRFAGFTEPWEQRKLGDECLEIIAGGDVDKIKLKKNGKYPVLANALSDKGIVGYYDDYYRVKAPAVTVTGRGDVGHAQARKVNFTPVVRLLSLTSKHDVDFLAEAINQKDTILESTGIPQLTVPKLASYRIYFPPTFDEELRIGKYFSTLDNLITLHQRKCDALKKVKKSLLQKMFPKEGSVVPEIRFAGFTEAWEQRKLEDIFKEYSEKNHAELPPLTIIQGQGTILRNKSDRHLSYDKESLSGYKFVKKGDFIVHLRSFEGGLEIAKSDGIISPAYHTLHSDVANSNFYYPYFRSHNFINNKLKNCVYGIRDGKSINLQEMKKIKISYTNIREQECIAKIFTNMDNLITLHQHENLKGGLL